MAWPVSSSDVLARGRVCNFVQETVVPPSGEPFSRQFISHPGAVGIIAVDEQDRVAVVNQYRHPVGLELVEPPAGLLDVDGEDFLVAAQRELAEEVQLRADDWRILVDVCTSPGGSEESARVFLATGLSEAPHPDGFVPEDEEAHMQVGWVPFDDLVDGVLAGRLQSPLLVAGIMALAAARGTGRLDHLRQPDAPWPVREVHARQQRDR
ncbi:NUDIX domain-containing protein [Propionibacteriaceae bacterium Y1923]|uniref:NUDIX domain-containing protein n=1 Tax=Aestuariimicrobium sp. Y1814 TaxID=3418742 RepID=UPI003C1FF681